MRDAEWIRRELGVERWSVLGQSFGGFCVTTYLSFAPEGLREAFFTGGLPPVGRADRRRLPAPRTSACSSATAATTSATPATATRVRELRRRLDAEDVRLPSGDRLTWPRFRQLGRCSG